MKGLKISLLTLTLLLAGSFFASAQTDNYKTSLKSFEGYYTTNLNGQRAFIQISAVNDGLKLKQLWDYHEIDFTRKSEMEFTGDAGRFPLKFAKSADGNINEMTAFNRDVWTRTNEYKPLTQTYTPTKTDLKAVEGYYQIRSNSDHVQFYIQDGKLLAKQMWDQKIHHMLAQSALEYISQEAGITVTFVKNDKGEVAKAELSQGDVLDRVKDYQPAK